MSQVRSQRREMVPKPTNGEGLRETLPTIQAAGLKAKPRRLLSLEVCADNTSVWAKSEATTKHYRKHLEVCKVTRQKAGVQTAPDSCALALKSWKLVKKMWSRRCNIASDRFNKRNVRGSSHPVRETKHHRDKQGAKPFKTERQTLRSGASGEQLLGN